MKTAHFAIHPYITEDTDFKSLQFGSRYIQSRMRKRDPNELALGYTQAMMAFLLLKPAPRDILIVGLGGGSLSKYCYQQLPSTRVTTIEVSQEVIAMRQEFCIPPDNSRFRVIHEDAAQYLRGKESIADVILLDGYDNSGIPPELSSTPFYRRCHSALNRDGVLVSHVNGSAAQTTTCLSRIHSVFLGKVLKVSSAAHIDVVFGLKYPEGLDARFQRSRAATLQTETGIDFPRFQQQMWRSARSWMGVGASPRRPEEH